MEYANIEWQGPNQNQPYSLDFNDVYFNSANGLDETEYVFIAQNQLKQRFKNLTTPTFTIIETGFGTGLNFYCTALHFLALAPKDATLHYISIEKFPLAPSDMQKVTQEFLKAWPQFTPIFKELLPQYTHLKPQLNQMRIAESRVSVDLWLDDVNDALPCLAQTADAWFLDGFAPAKNAEMWRKEMFQQMARLSKSHTTFATFTSAGEVRRGLLNAGFNVQKCAGFGKKREMLFGQFQ